MVFINFNRCNSFCMSLIMRFTIVPNCEYRPIIKSNYKVKIINTMQTTNSSRMILWNFNGKTSIGIHFNVIVYFCVILSFVICAFYSLLMVITISQKMKKEFWSVPNQELTVLWTCPKSSVSVSAHGSYRTSMVMYGTLYFVSTFSFGLLSIQDIQWAVMTTTNDEFLNDDYWCDINLWTQMVIFSLIIELLWLLLGNVSIILLRLDLILLNLRFLILPSILYFKTLIL